MFRSFSFFRLAILSALLVVVAIPATAAAAPDSDYSMHIDVKGTPRTYEDIGRIWLALPTGKVPVYAGGKRRKVTARGFSVCCDSATKVISRTRYSSEMAMVERPLTRREARTHGSKLAWIDGDVLLVHPSSPSCATGLSMAEVQAVLRGTDSRFATVYAPYGLMGNRELLFGLFSADNRVKVYGKNVKIVSEALAIFNVEHNPGHAAAVAWSAAREEIASGEVCAVPVNGKVVSEETLKSRAYPAWVHAHLVYRKDQFRGWQGYVRRWFTSFVVSTAARDSLSKYRDRRPLFQ